MCITVPPVQKMTTTTTTTMQKNETRPNEQMRPSTLGTQVQCMTIYAPVPRNKDGEPLVANVEKRIKRPDQPDFLGYAQFATPKHCVRVHFGNLAETAGPKTVDTLAAQTIGIARRRPSLTRCQVTTVQCRCRQSCADPQQMNHRIAFDDAAIATSQLSTVPTIAAPVDKFRLSGSPDSDCYCTAQYRRYELRTRITSSLLGRLRFPNRHNNTRCDLVISPGRSRIHHLCIGKISALSSS